MQKSKSKDGGDTKWVSLCNLNKGMGARGLLAAPPEEYRDRLASLLTPNYCSAVDCTGVDFSVMSVENGALLLNLSCRENIVAFCAVGTADSEAALAAWTSAFDIPATFEEHDLENSCPTPPVGDWLALYLTCAKNLISIHDFQAIQKFLHALPFALSRWEEMEKSTNDQN
jgi:hypothetical protein